METAMTTLSQLAAADKVADFFDLHTDLHAVAALEVRLQLIHLIVV